MKHQLGLVIISLFIASCDNEAVSPSDAFLIPSQKIAHITNEANKGDLKAVKRLIAHYEATSGDDAKAEYWRGKTRALSDPRELYYYAAQLLTRAKTEVEYSKKQSILIDAERAAQASFGQDPQPSTGQLIREIKQEESLL